MKSSNKELINLVQTVLETYKIKATGISLFIEKFELTEFIKDIIAEMKPIAAHTGNSIILHCEDLIAIKADKMNLKRVIKNLIHNAISYGANNTNIDIFIQQDSENITIAIRDYGKGIPAEDIKKIFQKYYSTAKKFRKTGTGLGLFLAQQIIKAHKGALSVVSEPEQYTEFRIKLNAIN